MTDKQFKLMQHLMRCNKQEKKKFIDEYLVRQYTRENCIVTKDFTIAFGDIPISLICHLDTVDENSKKYNKALINLYYDEKRKVLCCPGALGFDDNAGLFSIIQIIIKGYRPTIILCQDEELGGLGAQTLAETFPKAPIDLKYMIELDRQGKNDLVTYNCRNNEFDKYISSFGYRKSYGSYSDISFIAPIWNIAAANISVGYLNEHSYFEILRVDWLEKTIAKVERMLQDAETAPYFKYIGG